MTESLTPEDLESMRKIIEVLRFLVLRSQGIQLAPEPHLKKAKETVDLLAEKYKVPPFRP
jgi:hypothetical protein